RNEPPSAHPGSLSSSPSVRSTVPRTGFVYILASQSRRLYIGVTSDMVRRWLQHRTGCGSEFARQYQMYRLVLVERAPSMADAIRREKQIKGWVRRRKLALVSATNPGWQNLAVVWGWHRLVEDFARSNQQSFELEPEDPSLRSG
ncbi:MAG: GIY-YIG nuclease family protein, partial [Gemmatimonadota bacterium]